MTQISNLLGSYIHTTELNDLCTSASTITSEATIEDSTLKELNEALSEKNEELTLSVKQERKNEFSETLKTLDVLRDNWFKCLSGHVTADMKRPDEAFAKPADSIYRVMKNHGLLLYKESYEKESALLDSLFEDLDASPMQQALKAIGLMQVYKGLKKAQQDFRAAYLLRSKTAADTPQLIAASTLHKGVQESLDHLTQYLNLMVGVNSKKYTRLVMAIDDLITKVNRNIRARRAKGKDDEEQAD